MGFLDRLNEIVRAKNMSPKAVHEATGIPYDQLDRLGTGPRGPCAAKLRDIVVGLQVDANFLLEADNDRYEGMTSIQKAANMALDRYFVSRSRQGDPVDPADAIQLRHVADHSSKPPVWVDDWATHHERMIVSAGARPEPASPKLPPRVHRQRRPRP